MSTLFLIILIVVIAILFALEVILSLRKSRWPGLIIPAALFVVLTVFLVFNLLEAFINIEDFGRFLLDYGSPGIFALFARIAFLYSPVILNLIIYFIIRKVKFPKNNSKEINKMLADDL